MDLPEEIAYVVRRRRELGLSQAKVAELAGVSQAYISRLEKGKLDPRLSTLRRIVGVLEEGEGSTVRLREVMSAPVIAISPRERVSKAVRKMAEHGFSQLPILEGGVPVGSVSERAIMRRMAVTRNPTELAMRRVAQVMEPASPSLPPEAELAQALSLLQSYPMVLVAERGVVVGIVTRADVLRMLDQVSK